MLSALKRHEDHKTTDHEKHMHADIPVRCLEIWLIAKTYNFSINRCVMKQQNREGCKTAQHINFNKAFFLAIIRFQLPPKFSS